MNLKLEKEKQARFAFDHFFSKQYIKCAASKSEGAEVCHV